MNSIEFSKKSTNGKKSLLLKFGVFQQNRSIADGRIIEICTY